MSFVMRIEGFADGSVCPIGGEYLVSFDFDAGDGRGLGEFTRDVRCAKRFRTPSEAVDYWRTISRVRPKRDDGKPNMPLTASTVSISAVEDDVMRPDGGVH